MTEVTRRNNPCAGSLIREGELESANLAREHYENFVIGAFFLSKRLRQDLYNIYAFCRLGDDFADETPKDASPYELLDDWESKLISAERGEYNSPLFCALGQSIRANDLTLKNFQNLLDAFRLDVSKKRWKSWDELMNYTKLSANPVGRIVLELFSIRESEYFALSDKICTALQLANHWQDIYEDYQRGRIYIPQDVMEKFGVHEEDIKNREFTIEFRVLLEHLTQETESLFNQGISLCRALPTKPRLLIALYLSGGLQALRVIRRNKYDVLNKSSKLGAFDKIQTAFSALIIWLKKS